MATGDVMLASRLCCSGWSSGSSGERPAEPGQVLIHVMWSLAMLFALPLLFG